MIVCVQGQDVSTLTINLKDDFNIGIGYQISLKVPNKDGILDGIE